MTETNFVHLHLHSEYSLLDGGNRMKPLIAKVKELGMDAVALTDHGNLFGAVDFFKTCKAEGVKPILGIEAYVAPDVKTETSDRTLKEQQGVADGGFHLVLLAENETGWRHLLKLSSDAYIEGFYYRPRMDKTTLADWAEGLIAINGHLGSSIAYYLNQYELTGNADYYERAKAEAQWHAETFGTNENGEPCFYLELQRHETPEQHAINPHIVRLAEELQLPLVCDNDAHFLTADDWDNHDTLVCVSTAKSKFDESRLKYPKDLFVRSPQQMDELFGDLPEALENTRRIADRCNVELDFSSNHAPVVDILRRDPSDEFDADAPPGSSPWFQRFCSTYQLQPVDDNDPDQPSRTFEEREKDCDTALRELCEAGLVWRYGEDGTTADHRARLDRELKVLSDKHISAYFLIVWDFVSEARRRGIPAMARGSGVGTMVGYLLGLSNACPVRYGLLFERFTDPDRSEYPDIDIDLCQDGRAEIIDYVREKYGYVAQIITFGTMKARAAIRDVGRVLELPLPEVDRICKLIGDQLGVTIDKALEQEPELKSLCRDERIQQVVDTARALEGITRHSGVHAAGVVLATQPLDNLVPLATAKTSSKKDKKDGSKSAKDQMALVTQWDGPTVEQMGLLKMDFLGLKTLSVLERARQLVRETIDEETVRAASGITKSTTDPLDLDRIDFGDEKVLGLYQRGETVGTFQFESDGMRNLLLKMRPDRLEDLVAANALFRPGPMALIDDYCNRKHGRQQVPEVHEIVDDFTADTYGIMVYQEQVMQIVHELGGIPLREAYSLIKAISKKKQDTINASKARFIQGSQDKGMPRQKAEQLFELILRFAGYGFNKSHSVGYSILAFQTAFLKTYFPVQYMAAVLTFDADHTDKLKVYLDECKRVMLPNGERGCEVKPPDVNLSRVRFQVVYADGERPTPSGGHIRFGLSAVKGVGIKAVHAILEARDEGGPFESLFEFCERVPLNLVNRSTIEALIRAGAFDSLHGADQRAAMVHALEAAIRSGQQAAADRESGQSNLFGGAADEPTDATPETTLPTVEPWPLQEQLKYEKAALGFFASVDPLDHHRETLERLSNATSEQIATMPADMEVVVGAMVQGLRVMRTKKGRTAGQRMAMLTLEDLHGRLDAVVFSDLFEQHGSLLEEDGLFFFTGRVDRRREEPSLVISSFVPIEQAEIKLTSCLEIVLDGRVFEEAQDPRRVQHELEDLKAFLRSQRRYANGTGVEVRFVVEIDGQAIRTSNGDLRIPLRHGLKAEIEERLDSIGRCRLIGPGEPRMVEPEAPPWQRSA